MLEMVLNILTVICMILITMLAFHYVSMHRDYRKGILHRTGNLLLYWYLRVAVGIGYGKEALRIRLLSVFRDYQPDDGRMQEIYRKEERLAQLRKQRSSFSGGYGRKLWYNLKILK